MSWKRIAGGVMVAMPVVAWFLLTVSERGVWRGVLIFGSAVALVAWIVAGLSLLEGGSERRERTGRI
jgi:hypothetical protein